MDQSPTLEISVDRAHLPAALVVRIGGELDFGTTPRLLEQVSGEPPAGASVILDLRRLAFCDSSALGAMIAIYKAAIAGGGRLYLVGAQPQVLSAIEVTSLDQLFLLRADEATALAEVGAG